MSNYRDLAKRISDYTRTISLDVHMGVREALAYLDMFPDQVPARTITESRLAEVLADENWTFTPTHYFRVFSRLGITVVPDPEPTNAEKLRAMLEVWTDEYDGSPETFTDYLDRMGVKAPEADHD